MNKQHFPQIRYPKSRIDALTDGIFAVAMTILVLDIRIPEAPLPADADQLLRALLDLWPKFVPYVLSFMILGLRWLSIARAPARSETFNSAYVKWWLLYLLLITCIPFSTMMVGRFAGLQPAIWLYSGNTALIAVAAWRMAELAHEVEEAHHLRERRISMAFLLGTSLVCIAVSLVAPRHALLAYVLNLISPAVSNKDWFRF